MAVALVAVLVGIAVVDVASTTEPAPAADDDAGAEVTAQQPECRTVLLAGDSLAEHVGQVLDARYERTGHCAEVVNGGFGGSNPWKVGDEGNSSWADRLREQLATHEPDVVVLSFVGNTIPSDLAEVEHSYLALIDLVTGAGHTAYVTTPPLSAWSCIREATWSRGHRLLRSWVLDELPTLRPDVVFVPWDETLTPGGSYQDSVTTPSGETVRVRHPDCVHFEPAGAELAADLIVDATAAEWVA